MTRRPRSPGNESFPATKEQANAYIAGGSARCADVIRKSKIARQ
jgi:hypothetical protein